MESRTHIGARRRRLPQWRVVPASGRRPAVVLDATLEDDDDPTADLETPPRDATRRIEPTLTAPSFNTRAAVDFAAPPEQTVVADYGSRERANDAQPEAEAIAAPTLRKSEVEVDPIRAEPSASNTSFSVDPPLAASVDAAEVTEAVISHPRDLTTGSLLCNRYVLGRLLGSGGSSLIFQAEDRRRIGAEDFGSRIAIKVLKPEMRHNAHALTRLKREYRQMQRLAHPGIAHVYDLDCDEDIWFMTMELIDGLTINQWLRENSARADGMRIIGACCDALKHAHDSGIVHGDMKPSNVLVLANGGVKIVDFGSAAERDATTGVVDSDRSFAATPPYASPQILSGAIADIRDDVFSLACLTYAVLTRGEHPFARKSIADAYQANMRPAYSRTLQPRQFEAIVRGLSWEREQRPATVAEFLHALLASDLRRDVHTSSVDVPSAPVSQPETPAALRQPESVSVPQPTRDVSRSDATLIRAANESFATPQHESQPMRAVRNVDETYVRPHVEKSAPVSMPAKAASAPVASAHDEYEDDEAQLRAAIGSFASEPSATPTVVAAPEAESKKEDPLARFKGYVAGPHAEAPTREHYKVEFSGEFDADFAAFRGDSADAGEFIPEFAAPVDPTALHAPPASQARAAASGPQTQALDRSKRSKPWQGATLLVIAAVLGLIAFVANQFDFDAEPIPTASASPPRPVVKMPVEPLIQAPAPEPEVIAVEPIAVVTPPPAPRVAPGEITFASSVVRVGTSQSMAALSVQRLKSTRGRAKVAWSVEGDAKQSGVIEFLDGQVIRSLFIPLTRKDGSSLPSSFIVALKQAKGGPVIGEIRKVTVTSGDAQ